MSNSLWMSNGASLNINYSQMQRESLIEWNVNFEHFQTIRTQKTHTLTDKRKLLVSWAGNKEKLKIKISTDYFHQHKTMFHFLASELCAMRRFKFNSRKLKQCATAKGNLISKQLHEQPMGKIICCEVNVVNAGWFGFIGIACVHKVGLNIQSQCA